MNKWHWPQIPKDDQKALNITFVSRREHVFERCENKGLGAGEMAQLRAHDAMLLQRTCVLFSTHQSGSSQLP